MARIKRGTLRLRDVKRGDKMDFSVLFKGYDLAGKNLAMDVRRDASSVAVLRFSTEDGSIEVVQDIVNDGWTVTFKKTSLQMKVNAGTYKIDVEAYTTDEDTETICDGYMEIVPEITKRIK